MQALCKLMGLTGCNRLVADFNLIAQLIMIVALCIGFYFARTRQIPKHRRTQMTVVFVNLIFIAGAMLTSFYAYVIDAATTTGIVAQLMIAHGILGLIAEGMGLYIVTFMLRRSWIPEALRIKNFKRFMRTLLTLWMLIILLGLEIYYFYYLANSGSPTTQALFNSFTLLADLLGIFMFLWIWDFQLPPVARFGIGLVCVALGLALAYVRFDYGINKVLPNIIAASIPTLAPTPTSAPTNTPVPAPTNTPAPTPTPIPARGQLSFENTGASNDTAIALLVNVPQPAAGRIYQAWLASSTVSVFAAMGEVKVSQAGTATVKYVDPKGGNLLALYDQFFVTVESAPATRPSNTLIFSGQFAQRLAGEVKLLMGLAPDTPNKAGYVIGINDIIDNLKVHAAEVREAAERGSLPTTKRHAEHMINLLVGSKDKGFGDLDKDGNVEDPGDGFGLLPYANQIAASVQRMAKAPDATAELKQRAAELQVANANFQKWCGDILKNSRAILTATDVKATLELAKEIEALGRLAVDGQDKNGNKEIELIPDEAGFTDLYFAAQKLAGLSLTPIQANLVQTLNLPTPTPPPAPTATPTPVPQSKTVLMQDFVYKDKTLTIDKGTTVIFVNKDNAKHTVTSDSGKPLDSKDIGANAQYKFTFDTPGTFPYYCEYHGDKGGVGMAGTIVVK